MPVVLSFDEVEQLYYQAFIDEFGKISITQWRGSYEYQALYPAIQLMVENGVITENAMNEILLSLEKTNQHINRPAVLVTRVVDRFKEAGYNATIREATNSTKGIVAICVDYTRTAEQDRFVADLIGSEMLPAGQFMEGSIVEQYVLTNGQNIQIAWETPTNTPILWKIELTRDINSSYAVDDVDTIRQRFLKNFLALAPLGLNIRPAVYYQIDNDAPWASVILSEYSLDSGATWSDKIKVSAYTDKYIAELPPANIKII